MAPKANVPLHRLGALQRRSCEWVASVQATFVSTRSMGQTEMGRLLGLSSLAPTEIRCRSSTRHRNVQFFLWLRFNHRELHRPLPAAPTDTRESQQMIRRMFLSPSTESRRSSEQSPPASERLVRLAIGTDWRTM